MLLTLPIYVESRKPAGGTTVFHARPLFFDGPSVRGERLERVMTRLTQDLGQHLTGLGKQQRHDALAACTFAPRLTQQRLELTLTLRRRTARCRFLFVSFRQFGRRLAFTPSVPDVWFDLARGEVLRDRADEVLTRHFREREREEDEVDPEKVSLTGAAYVTPLEIVVEPPAVPPPPPQMHFLGLGDAPKVEGGAELRRVGRCLDRLYPDELDRVLLREAELEELTRLLAAPEQRPVLLVGPRQVGKTALVHEYVFRQVSQRDASFRDRRNVWLLAPQRLISGMSYVGQWENRVLAILREARRRRHILYFDDLLCLFQAGHSSNSTLSIAGVLKPYLERREVRVLGEITPEALRVLREQDRGFADLFYLLPVAEPDEAGTLRILIGVQRHAEGQQRCRFDLDVLPTVLDLQRRYGRGLAFPGKAASFLRQLAARHRGGTVSRAETLAEFRLRSGLSTTFLDRRTRLDREEVLEALAKHVIGQDAALLAAADVIAIARARINDPDRPLASFLFLGPTGVGKTQCARALAAYLFGEAERLLRFDLNEYADAGSAARLVGTFRQPEGLLTSAVRRQPFAVVLFDEVEKAHPEVFDLLLQVLGEGRLTDALGRTTDFGNTLIVLTSNLGVRQAESHLGLRASETAAAAVFVQAAERFFRPEFFNRLDRILPFGRLTRAHVRGIARKLIRDVFGREGLLQRRCILFVEPEALERVVDRGYDPVLGARALKRAIESEVAQPVAAQLAALPVGGFTAVRVYPGAAHLTVHVQPLEQVAVQPRPSLDLDRPEPLLRRVRGALRRIEDAFAPLRPAEPLTLGQVDADAQRYFLLREQAENVRAEIRELSEQLEDARLAAQAPPTYQRPDVARRRFKDYHFGCTLSEMAAALDINEYLHDLALSATALATGPNAAQLLRLLDAAALLHTLAEGIRGSGPERVLLWIHSQDGEHAASIHDLHSAYRMALPKLHLDIPKWQSRSEDDNKETYLIVQGPHAVRVAGLESGTHLYCPLHAAVEPVQVEVLPLPPGSDAEAVLAEQQARRRSWLQALSAGTATLAEDPFRLGRVVRIYDKRSGLFDLRTGLNVPAGRFSDCLRAALPLPPEVLAPADEE